MNTYTIEQLKAKLANIEDSSDPFLVKLGEDPRKGVQSLLRQWEKKQHALKEEQKRLFEMAIFEQRARKKGFKLIAGVDEAGRGPLAGPVVAAAVILPDSFIPGIKDSKKLSRKKLLELNERIKKEAIGIGLGIISSKEIDEINIYKAAKKAMLHAIADLPAQPDYLLVDAMTLHSPYPEEAIVKGDMNSVSIAAASIVAKVARDQLMQEIDSKYPEYHFADHKGYATQAHLKALQTFGPCPVHRRSFAPVQAAIKPARGLNGNEHFFRTDV